jgi:hypothetical protein
MNRSRTESEGSIVASEGSIVASEGSIVASEGSIVASEGSNVASEGSTVAEALWPKHCGTALWPPPAPAQVRRLMRP